jgi:L-aminopeptidase/D-esterase-like protein
MHAARPGSRNLITDVDGILVGQAGDKNAKTGVSVIFPESPCVCAIDVRGGGPGTRESDALSPVSLVDKVDAVVLSGGSVYGLAAADGVAAALGAQGRGFSLLPDSGAPVSPIVPAAILYDLANEGDKDWGETPPYQALGRKALAGVGQHFALGRAGAGKGAMAGAYAGGVGSASFMTEEGWQIGALAAVNAFGSPFLLDQKTGRKIPWAWALEQGEEFGGVRPDGSERFDAFAPDTKLAALARQNTTIAVVAVNAVLNVAEAQRLAIMAQDGLARALRPVHGPTDGDVVFAMATGAKPQPLSDPLFLTRMGALAADCLARAITRAVIEAEKQEI